MFKAEQNMVDKKVIAKLFGNTFRAPKGFMYKPGTQIKQLKCRLTMDWLKIPLRLNGCNHLQSIFNYSSNTDHFQCQECKTKEDVNNLVIDLRLMNILTKMLEEIEYLKIPVKSNWVKVLTNRVELKVDAEGNIKLIFTSKQNTFSVTEQKYKELQDQEEDDQYSKRFIIQNCKDQCSKYFSDKISKKTLSKKLENEIKHIYNKISPIELINRIKKESFPSRKIEKNNNLFGFSDGFLIVCQGNKYIKANIVGKEDIFSTYHGASWFSANGKIYSVGGQTLTGKTYSKNIFCFERNDATTWKISKLFQKDNNALDLLNPGVCYYPQTNSVFIIGGLQREKLIPSNKILQFKLSTGSLDVVATLSELRINPMCVRVQQSLYIIGGINYQSYKKNKSLDLEQLPSTLRAFQEKSIEKYNIFQRKLSKINPICNLNDFRFLCTRGVAITVPFYKKNVIVIFGGHYGNMVVDRFAVFLDLKTMRWRQLLTNRLSNTYTVGQDKILSQEMNIVDFIGQQKENSTKFLFVGLKGEKIQEFVLSSISDGTYRWKY